MAKHMIEIPGKDGILFSNDPSPTIDLQPDDYNISDKLAIKDLAAFT